MGRPVGILFRVQHVKALLMWSDMPRIQLVRCLLAPIVFLLVGGCRSTVVGPPDIVEPTDPVSFSNDVFPIFEQSCALSGCHAGSGTNGVRLGSYVEAASSVGLQYGELVIQPFDADGSPIVDKISGVPLFGVRMPFGGKPLSGEQIGLIRGWIDQGAQNN